MILMTTGMVGVTGQFCPQTYSAGILPRVACVKFLAERLMTCGTQYSAACIILLAPQPLV
jgi:hypothetical protein